MKKKKILSLFIAAFVLISTGIGDTSLYAEESGTVEDKGNTENKENKENTENTDDKGSIADKDNTTDKGASEDKEVQEPVNGEEAPKEDIPTDEATKKEENADHQTEKEKELSDETKENPESAVDANKDSNTEKPASKKAKSDTPSEAAFTPNAGNLFVTSSGSWSYDATDDMITITGDGKRNAYTILGGGSEVTTKIQISSSGEVYLTLDSINIKTSSTSSFSPLELGSAKKVVLTIKNTVELNGTSEDRAVIHVPDTSSLEIKDGGNGNLQCLQHSETSTAASIGSDRGYTNGPITIHSGIMSSVAKGTGAAIGSGENGNADNITINGGSIYALNANDGAGIGSGSSTGRDTYANNITINGGDINAVSVGLVGPDAKIGRGAGIGAGYNSKCNTITINGGTINAESESQYGLGEKSGKVDNIYINGGSVRVGGKSMPEFKNSDSEPVFLINTLPSQDVTSIVVDGVDYKISGNHSNSNLSGSAFPTNDKKFYLYLSPRDHVIVTSENAYKAVWNNINDFSYNETTTGDLVILGGTEGLDYLYSSSSDYIRILKSGNYSVYNKRKTSNTVLEVAISAANVNLTINDLNIVPASSSKKSPLSISTYSKTKLIIKGNNKLVCEKYAALEVASGSEFVIEGDGILDVTSHQSVGIGGSDGVNNGLITINSGKIIVNSMATTIGTDLATRGEHITINGGTLTLNNGGNPNYLIDPGSREYSVYINGGSVYDISGDYNFRKSPLNNVTGDRVEAGLYEMKNREEDAVIKVDGVVYPVSGYHTDGTSVLTTSYYIFMTKSEHTVTDDYGFNATVDWDVDRFKLKSTAVPTSVTATSTTNSITVTSTLTDTATYGNASYSIDGKTWQTSNIFNNLKANTSYTVQMRYGGTDVYCPSVASTKAITTGNAGYTITIPNKITAGDAAGNIAVNTGQNFDLGYGGQVNIKATSGVTSAGVLTLTRTTGTTKPTLTSQLKVNGTSFTNTTANVATFKAKTDASVPISFTKPTITSGVIPAGAYTGTTVFTVTYTQ